MHTKEHEWPVTRSQLWAGRLLAGLGVRDLARLTGYSVTTISKIENGRTTTPNLSTVEALVRTLQGQGVEFAPGGWVRHCRDHAHPGAGLATAQPFTNATRSRLIRLAWRILQVVGQS